VSEGTCGADGTYQNTDEVCNMQPCECVITTEDIQDAWAATPGPDMVLGWIEKDMNDGFNPSVDEPIKVNQTFYEEHFVQIGDNDYNLCGFCKCEGMDAVCEKKPCPDECVWGEWGPWSVCPEECGTQNKTRSRELEVPQTEGKCKGKKEETDFCNVEPCPPEWSTWASWSTCDCEGGVRNRTRFCGSQEAAYKCGGDSLETEKCGDNCGPCVEPLIPCDEWKNATEDCPLTTCSDVRGETNCQLADPEFCNDTVCYCPVGEVLDEQDNTCKKPEACPCRVKYNDTFVEADSIVKIPETCETCVCLEGKLNCSDDDNKDECECVYTEWSEWSECTEPCDVGKHVRTRQPVPPERTDCHETIDEEECIVEDCKPCVIDGKTYEINEQISHTHCERCYCDENSEETCVSINDVDGGWSDWSEWSMCSGTCKGAYKRRTRTCDDPLPSCDGTCEGPGEDTVPCNEDVDCDQKECEIADNTIFATNETCEYTCDVPYANTEGSCPNWVYNNCTCKNNYVKSNGSCIPIDECQLCRLENGTVLEEGKIIYLPDDDCIPVMCKDGVIVKGTLEDYQQDNCLYTEEACTNLPGLGQYKIKEGECCGTCEPEQEPSKSCAVVKTKEKLEAHDENKVLCVTPSPVEYARCEGTCNSVQKGAIMINGTTGSAASVDCKCCSGTGDLEDITFDCAGQQTVFQVYQMKECSCNTCTDTGSKEDEEESQQAAEPAPNASNFNSLF